MSVLSLSLVFDKWSSFETLNAQKAVDRFLTPSSNKLRIKICVSWTTSLRLVTAVSGPPSRGAAPAPLTPTLFGVIGGTARTHAPGDVGMHVQTELRDDSPTGSLAEATGLWSLWQPTDPEMHRLLTPSSFRAM